jgi:putative component of toxin-antitoxin plasmid stabilization module
MDVVGCVIVGKAADERYAGTVQRTSLRFLGAVRSSRCNHDACYRTCDPSILSVGEVRGAAGSGPPTYFGENERVVRISIKCYDCVAKPAPSIVEEWYVWCNHDACYRTCGPSMLSVGEVRGAAGSGPPTYFGENERVVRISIKCYDCVAKPAPSIVEEW